MENYVIEVLDVVKHFKETIALNHISLKIEAGKIHGIIGRNGSGKTVLLKCICGFMQLNAGQILINKIPVKPALSQDIGIIIDEPGFISSLSGFTNLKLLASINKKVSPKRIREVLSFVGLNPDDKKHVGKYSLGMRQRLAIAQAIMEDPQILILDEPMNGLDNQGVEDIRKLLAEMRDSGKTILLASHSKEDIAILCDTVHEMDYGQIVYSRVSGS